MGSKQSKAIGNDTVTAASKTSTPTPTENQNESNELTTKGAMPNDSIHKHLSSEGGGGCPMKNKEGGGYFGSRGGRRGWFGNSDSNSNSSSNNNKDGQMTSTATSSGCPVKHNQPNNSQVEYNVYSQPIDPNNNMPSVANQLPSPMQTIQLPTDRVQSTIPKGSTSNNNDDDDENDNGSNTNTWTYPSPQMFYNSLARKNKLGDTTEEDVESVVALHNNMNEKTWAKVIQWEKTLMGEEDGNQSKLLKFMGRPSDLSPKARFKNLLFGHPLPFDRHDWTVIRKDGEQVRYVIDYYYDESRASEAEESGMPAMDDFDAVQSILVDVRPAVDTAQATFGRVFTMPMARHVQKSTDFVPLPMLPTSDLKSQVMESQKVWADIQRNVEESRRQSGSSANSEKSMVLKQEDIPHDQRNDNDNDNDEDHELPKMSDAEAKEIALSFASMVGQCQKAQKVVESCTDEAECAKASLALTMCLAKVVCPLQQNAVEKALNDENVNMNDEKAVAIYNVTFDKALENMAVCVNAKSEKVAIARQTHPHLFKDV